MAADQVALMRALGHAASASPATTAAAASPTALALDHPDAVERLAVLDIVPTATMYARTDARSPPPTTTGSS